jgi:hypothetical protein
VKKVITGLALVAVMGAVVLMTVGTAAAKPPAADGSAAAQVCPEDGKVEVSGEQHAITIEAPDGYAIVSYCVKAGSAKQGCGAMSHDLTEPASSVTIHGPCGKAISHYSVTYVELPTDPPGGGECPEGQYWDESTGKCEDEPIPS